MPTTKPTFTHIMVAAIRITEDGKIKTYNSTEAAMNSARPGDHVVRPSVMDGEPVVFITAVEEP